MSKNIRTEAVDHLFEAILCLKDKEDDMVFKRMEEKKEQNRSLDQKDE